MTAAEVETRKRLEGIYAGWKFEDAELDMQMLADMQKAMAEAGIHVPTAPR